MVSSTLQIRLNPPFSDNHCSYHQVPSFAFISLSRGTRPFVMKMTKSSAGGYENMESWMISSRHGDDTESGDEEALSLCDLPITINRSDGDRTRRPEILKRGEEKVAQAVKTHEAAAETEPEPEEEEFNFGSSKGNLELEMCAADEVFLCGQILPFRHSISSSDTGRLSCPTRRILSRSGSMDHYVSAAASAASSTATTTASSSTRSSRSSSTRSYSSSGSSSSGSANYNNTNSIASFSHHHHHQQQRKAKVRNNFQYYSYQHPSPKPQVRTSSSRRSSISGPTSGRKSGSTTSMWEFLRLGLIRTPNEIALQDLKVRSRNSAAVNSNKTGAINDLSRNSSSGSCSSSSGSSNKGTHNVVEIKANRGQKGLNLSYKQTNCMNLNKNGGLFSGGGCKCSVGEEVVEPSPRVIVVKSNSCVGGGEQKKTKHMTGAGKRNIESNEEDKVLLLQKKQEEEDQRQGKQGRQKAMSSRHRMSEWLKELTVVTHAGGHVLNEF